MKKFPVIFLALFVVGLLLAGCGDSGGDAVSMGLGIVTSIDKSRDYSLNEDGLETLARGQADTVVAAATFDKDGKVVSVIIDTAQSIVNYDAEMAVTSDTTAKIKTKKELGDEYDMRRVSGIKKEWFEQVASLEEWMIGKTVEEIKSLKVKKADDAHPAIPDDPDLTSLVTITVQDYIAAVEKAYKNAVEVKGAVKLGLGHTVSIGSSRGYSINEETGIETLPRAQADAVFAATAFDKNDKVVRTIIDTAQTRIDFDKDGKVTSDKTAKIKTKKELGDDYDMRRVSGIGKEWFEQVASLEEWMSGKTVAEIKNLKVKKADDAHPAIPDDPDLTSLVTITVHDYLAAVEESYANAK